MLPLEAEAMIRAPAAAAGLRRGLHLEPCLCLAFCGQTSEKRCGGTWLDSAHSTRKSFASASKAFIISGLLRKQLPRHGPLDACPRFQPADSNLFHPQMQIMHVAQYPKLSYEIALEPRNAGSSSSGRAGMTEWWAPCFLSGKDAAQAAARHPSPFENPDPPG